MSYDFEDHLIREMVNRDHRPQEKRTMIRSLDGKLRVNVQHEVVCCVDLEAWPCDAITGFRAWQRTKLAEKYGNSTLRLFGL